MMNSIEPSVKKRKACLPCNDFYLPLYFARIQETYTASNGKFGGVVQKAIPIY